MTSEVVDDSPLPPQTRRRRTKKFDRDGGRSHFGPQGARIRSAINKSTATNSSSNNIYTTPVPGHEQNLPTHHNTSPHSASQAAHQRDFNRHPLSIEQKATLVRSKYQQDFPSNTSKIKKTILIKPKIKSSSNNNNIKQRKIVSNPSLALRNDNNNIPTCSSPSSLSHPIITSTPIQPNPDAYLSAAVIPIQTEIRRYLAYIRAKRRLRSITIIQSFIRRIIAEDHLSLRIYSITIIQSNARRYIRQQQFQREKSAVVVMQRIVRGYLTFINVGFDMEDIIIVQSVIRRRLAVIEVTRRQLAGKLIVNSAKTFLSRHNFIQKRSASTVIQSAYRGYLTYHFYHYHIMSVVRIQSAYRRHLAIWEGEYRRYCRDEAAACRIQTWWRCHDMRLLYMGIINDVIIAQSAVRGYIVRERVLPRRMAQRRFEACISIQSAVRMWLVRSWYQMEQGAMQIQTIWRGYFIRRCYVEYRAATTIQRYWRGKVCWTDYMEILVEIIIVQRMVRKWLGRRRAERERRELRVMEGIMMEKAAVMVQKCWRGYVVSVHYLNELVGVIIVQSIARRYLARQSFYHHRAARLIQSTYRGHSYRTLIHTSATIIQNFHLTCAHRRRNVRNTSAIIIQTAWRKFVSYSNYLIIRFENHAATNVQRVWRGFYEYSYFVIARYYAGRMQALVRGKMARRHALVKMACVLMIQAAGRGYLARLHAQLRRMVGVLGNSMHLARREEMGSVVLQRCWRRFGERKKAMMMGADELFAEKEVSDGQRKRQPQRDEKAQKAWMMYEEQARAGGINNQQKERNYIDDGASALLERMWHKTMKKKHAEEDQELLSRVWMDDVHGDELISIRDMRAPKCQQQHQQQPTKRTMYPDPRPNNHATVNNTHHPVVNNITHHIPPQQPHQNQRASYPMERQKTMLASNQKGRQQHHHLSVPPEIYHRYDGQETMVSGITEPAPNLKRSPKKHHQRRHTTVGAMVPVLPRAIDHIQQTNRQLLQYQRRNNHYTQPPPQPQPQQQRHHHTRQMSSHTLPTSLINCRHHISDSNDNMSTVSGITNPTYLAPPPQTTNNDRPPPTVYMSPRAQDEVDNQINENDEYPDHCYHHAQYDPWQTMSMGGYDDERRYHHDIDDIRGGPGARRGGGGRRRMHMKTSSDYEFYALNRGQGRGIEGGGYYGDDDYDNNDGTVNGHGMMPQQYHPYSHR